MELTSVLQTVAQPAPVTCCVLVLLWLTHRRTAALLFGFLAVFLPSDRAGRALEVFKRLTRDRDRRRR
jgi:hypothetical protein